MVITGSGLIIPNRNSASRRVAERRSCRYVEISVRQDSYILRSAVGSALELNCLRVRRCVAGATGSE